MQIEDFVREREGGVGAWHPLLRFLDAHAQNGDTLTCEVQQDLPFLGYSRHKICVHVSRNGKEHDRRSDDWDDDLNRDLVRRGIRSVSNEAEKDRFALALRAALRKPEGRFGDGYFNAAVTEFVRESPFRDHPEVALVLPHIHRDAPRKGRRHQECREMIEEAIRGRGLELTKSLNYSTAEASDILAGALARYLDTRFSVSSRRALGL